MDARSIMEGGIDGIPMSALFEVFFSPGKAFDQTVCPMDLKIGMSAPPQPKVESAFVHRIKTRLTHDSLGLHLTTVLRNDP